LGLKRPNGIPSHDTFNRVFADLNPVAFRYSFVPWINGVSDALGVCYIPIDGQTLREMCGPDGTWLHLVSAWAAEQRAVLAPGGGRGQE
jgi:hypothetical protein